MSREELAWAAGLFEGEGCFCHHADQRRKKDRGIMARIKMTDEDVIAKFRSIVGFGQVNVPYEQVGKKTVWIWQTGSFELVQALMAMLWPWLCSRRRAKVKDLLEWYHSQVIPKRGIARRDPITGRIQKGKLVYVS